MNSVDDDRPLAKCPVTDEPLFVGARVLRFTEDTEIICPSCKRRHRWDPVEQVFVDLPEERQ